MTASQLPTANNLDRFVKAQDSVFQDALDEIRSGNKRSHWMWFIFPQLYGLGRSEQSQMYGIRNLKEAQDYLAHPVLCARLEQVTRLVLDGKIHPRKMFGQVDYQKFVSCMTLFMHAAPTGSLFASVLQKFSAIDAKTTRMLGESNDKL